MVPLCPRHHRLEEPDVSDVPGLLYAVDEVFNLCLSHLAAEMCVVTEDLLECHCHCFYDLMRDGEGLINSTFFHKYIIGVSTNEPHTSATSLRPYVCKFACLLAGTNHLLKL